MPRLADVIVEQLENQIIEGVLKPGVRLPAERALAEHMGVSRPSLREAIQRLTARGLLYSRQGGGTYVTDQLETAFSNPWEELIRQNSALHGDVLEFRRVMEGVTAEAAASRATAADLQRLQEVVQCLQAAYASGDLQRQSEADVAFHIAVADASHNVMFSHLVRSLLNMLDKHVEDNIAQLFAWGPVADELMAQHNAIWEAISSRNPQKARLAAEAHIDFVAHTLGELKEQKQRQQRAQRRAGAVE